MITDVEAYFASGCGRCARFATPDCSTRQWLDGLLALRRICQDAGLEETAKWGHPCYMHAGRNIAIMGAFRDNFRLTFFNAALMKDPQGLLERQGENTMHPDMIRFTDNAQVTAHASAIATYLKEAMHYAEKGIKATVERSGLELPDELVAALEDDPELAAAFHALTPGRQKSHVINLASARQAKTRIARIERLRPKILAGKGANEY